MSAMDLKVLMIAEQCNPDWSSVPLACYNFYREISQIVDVTLVTHKRNRQALEQYKQHQQIFYIGESQIVKEYHVLIQKITHKGVINWPLYNALAYPIYAEFNYQVDQLFNREVREGKYDIVHAITPMMPRYPVKLVKACDNTPLLLGPVNGGVPFPKGFEETAKKEKVHWNFLRAFGRHLIPGYVQTYQKADRILSGSTYTLNMLKELFAIADHRIELLFENGITKDFLSQSTQREQNKKVELLFVGRLVPYKGADMLIEAIARLESSIQNRISLTIIGDGSEREDLHRRVQALNLTNTVKFTGWIKQQDTLEYYRKSDIFCFPSIREFGEAVVMEAMACGLPCIVVNNGGIGEYVTTEIGFKIEPMSREYVVQEMANKITLLTHDAELRKAMSGQATQKAQDFEWSSKARKVVEIYQELIDCKKSAI